jgi:hypothetical protein
MDADLVLVDPASVEPIEAEALHTAVGWTPFEGFDAIFPEWRWSAVRWCTTRRTDVRQTTARTSGRRDPAGAAGRRSRDDEDLNGHLSPAARTQISILVLPSGLKQSF